jgi:hypothetical protein
LAVNAPAGRRTSGITQPPVHAIAVQRILDRARVSGRSTRAVAEAFLDRRWNDLVRWHRWLAEARPDELFALAAADLHAAYGKGELWRRLLAVEITVRGHGMATPTPGGADVVLAGGGSARLDEASVVRDAPLLVAIDADERRDRRPQGQGQGQGQSAGRGGQVLVRVASMVTPEMLLELFPDALRWEEELSWNAEAERVDAFERGLVVEALRTAGGNRTEAARKLGISRVTLHDKLHKHGLARGGDE